MTEQGQGNLARAADAEVLLVDFGAGTHGHRGQWNAMLARLFNLRHAPFGLRTIVARQPILAPQIEHSPAGFLLTCLVRALLGRRTVGLLLRPLPALIGTSLRLRLKRLTLRLLRLLPGTQVLTIVPFALEPGFARIAHGWIHDLQNWDMQLGSSADGDRGKQLSAAIRAEAGQRRICCAIGRQDRAKGFDRFARSFVGSPDLRGQMLFAFGGQAATDVARDAAMFAEAGGFALDRMISDAEIFGLYGAADLVWCVYDPAYDQASGILGRAMQLGIPVAVRPGSLIERFCLLEGHPHVAIADAADWSALVALPQPLAPEAASARARRHGELSLARLAAALGVRPAEDPFAQGRLA